MGMCEIGCFQCWCHDAFLIEDEVITGRKRTERRKYNDTLLLSMDEALYLESSADGSGDPYRRMLMTDYDRSDLGINMPVLETEPHDIDVVHNDESEIGHDALEIIIMIPFYSDHLGRLGKEGEYLTDLLPLLVSCLLEIMFDISEEDDPFRFIF